MSEMFVPIDPTYAFREMSSHIIKSAEEIVKNGDLVNGTEELAKLVEHYLLMDVLTSEQAEYLISLADVAIDYFLRRKNDVK